MNPRNARIRQSPKVLAFHLCLRLQPSRRVLRQMLCLLEIQRMPHQVYRKKWHQVLMKATVSHQRTTKVRMKKMTARIKR